MTKDQWIQRAKALLFDLGYCLSWNTHGMLMKEMEELIAQGGGFNPGTESAETPLRWPRETEEDALKALKAQVARMRATIFGLRTKLGEED